jgi:hypothetical protein
MNWKQIVIVISALALSALIVWHDLPIEFPGGIIRVLMLFVKISLIVALAIFSYIFATDKKKSS